MMVHLALLLALASPGRSTTTINAVLGDASWIATRGSSPDADAGEATRILTHLRYVHRRLSRRVDGLSPSQQQRRGAALATLERYIARRVFPRRTGDAYPGRRPRFIDDHGVHCAVGFLIAESGEPELARAINARYEFDYVRDIAEPRLVAWATANGFTIDELAMIQPTYGPDLPPTADTTRRRLEETRELLTLACATKHPAVTRVDLHVAGDRRARITATTNSTDPFAQCVAAHARSSERADHDYDAAPVPFAFDITLELATPQSILDHRLALADLDAYCTPRPGAIPDTAQVDVSTTKQALVVAVTTTPSNHEIEQCIEERTHRYLDVFAGIVGLTSHRELDVVSRLATDKFRWDVQMTARSIAMACNADKPSPPTFELTVSAKRDREQFAIDIGAKDQQLAACVRERLPPVLRRAYTVSRPIGPGKAEWYFRIDTDLRVTVPIIMNK